MRFDLSDEEWTLLEPLMPKSRKKERADRRPQDNERDLLCATYRHALAGFARTLRALRALRMTAMDTGAVIPKGIRPAGTRHELMMLFGARFGPRKMAGRPSVF